MHDTNPFARVPASEPVAERSLLNDLLATFEKQLTCTFKEESYLVRDNGAVLRRPRPMGRRRKLDRIWTFGTLNRHSSAHVPGLDDKHAVARDNHMVDLLLKMSSDLLLAIHDSQAIYPCP